MEERMTLVALAERTGLSVTTISRVLSGQAEKYRISPKTVEYIKQEADRCNYRPNVMAQSLRTKRTRTIGLVVPAISNPFFANIASAIVQKARELGYTVILSDAMEDAEQEEEGVRSLLLRHVDGIIVSTSAEQPAFLEQVNESAVPVVLIDRYFAETTLPYVVTDNYSGALEAVSHLINRGHQRVACICGVRHSAIVQERMRGYVDAMQRAGLERFVHCVGDEFSVQNGYIEAKLLLNSNPLPTALFTMNNTILLGAIKAIKESGLRIPEDISVVSFDDNPFLDYISPAITRIVQPQNELGSIALRILIRSIEENERSDARIKLSPILKLCDSVALYDK
ncbi:MAG: LacI family DNA-binding transcriptional regulator [Alistipes sp.]|nr:LacI family DNA-binding transcriptional regulator [Alistipes sp.]